MTIATKQGVNEICARYGITAKKKLGQHFLTDPHVLGKIITAAEIGKNDLILEVGPGLGGMTQLLAQQAGFVLAVELDKQLVPILSDLFKDENVSVIQGDILRVDLADEISKLPTYDTIKVVANLPYYITTPVIFYLLESGIKFTSITVMVQKEVARRMSAKPSTKSYGSLTLAIQYHADATLVANVPTNCFIPRPAVDSAVVRLDILPTPRVSADKENLFKIIHAAFGKRRKTLINALDSEGIGNGKSHLATVLEQCGISPQARGETLDIFQFARLAEQLEF